MEKICLPVTNQGTFAYNICLREDYADLAECFARLESGQRRVCIVTDTHVDPLYGDLIQEALTPVCRETFRYVLPAGEENKTLSEIQGIYRFLIEHGFDRQDLLVALGGGVIGDMTGYAAATYLRGIRFVQIPTTLLSQVDSSIGGKTGVDFDCYKNMVGAFHMPSLVYIALTALRTLPDEQFASGMGEVLKHGLIRDGEYYAWTISHMDQIRERDLEICARMVEQSVKIKRAVVEKDPTEKGERALLNFGHTLGHAIEKLKNFTLLHGQCVALGCVAAAHISWQRGYLTEDEFYEIRDMMVGFDLPISFDSLDPGEIIAAARHDKKMSGGRIRFVLLRGIGDAFTDLTVSEEEMRSALRSIDADLWEAEGRKSEGREDTEGRESEGRLS